MNGNNKSDKVQIKKPKETGNQTSRSPKFKVANKTTKNDSPLLIHYQEDSLIGNDKCQNSITKKQNEQPSFRGNSSIVKQAALAIKENIKSCYMTQHSLPQIEMARIEKLKMRRIQYLKETECFDSKNAMRQHEVNEGNKTTPI